jgi:hypothetical protein
MKIIDVRLRPPFQPYLGAGNMFDMELDNPFALKNFYKNFGMKLSDSMREASMENLIQEMDRAGEMTGVVSIRKNSRGYENEPLLDLLKNYPGRFLGACGIHPDSSAETLNTLQRYVVDGPCISAFMEPGFHGVMIDDEALFPTYEFCEKHEIPLLISFGGFHGPTDEFCKPVHAGKVADAFPRLKIALCHACWPWVEPAVRLAFSRPNVYLSPDIYALHSAGAQSYIEAANYMLRDKILYGSAYPCVDIETSVAMYLEKLRPEVAENIMYKNAERFFGLQA